jgi:hypothetical protein
MKEREEEKEIEKEIEIVLYVEDSCAPMRTSGDMEYVIGVV